MARGPRRTRGPLFFWGSDTEAGPSGWRANGRTSRNAAANANSDGSAPAAFILWGLYRLFQKDSRGCMFFVGIAFAFKQQTLFILPFLVILWLKEETVRFRDFVYLPLLYVLGAVPA